jgi:catechol 2,3-dioxygenase-like lactoylglutathione lyase family enzyme
MFRKPFTALLLAVALTVAFVPSARAQVDATAVRSGGIRCLAVGAVATTVADMERSIRFYTEVLSFEKVSDFSISGEAFEQLLGVSGEKARIVRIRLGDETLELIQFIGTTGRPIPFDSHSNDRWFQHVAIIVSDMDRAYAVLRKNKVEHASSAPQTLPEWNPTAGGIKAFYFKDPDGHPLEILSFPAGKGEAKWHQPTEKLFLGIDHTAIVVADTDESLNFYRDLLGMRVVGESENYGPEQEHLNAVFAARVRITALRASTGPGIELLEYLSPRDGRPYPQDERATDLLHRQTVVEVPNTAMVAATLRSAGTKFVSPNIVAIANRELGFLQALLVRDPDGHPITIVQRSGQE